MGLDQCVRILGHREDIDEITALSDVVAIPSLTERFSVLLVETMALGKPIVAFHVGGIPEVISNGVKGLLVEPGSTLGLASALQTMIDNPQLREMCSRDARERVLQFTQEKRSIICPRSICRSVGALPGKAAASGSTMRAEPVHGTDLGSEFGSRE